MNSNHVKWQWWFITLSSFSAHRLTGWRFALASGMSANRMRGCLTRILVLRSVWSWSCWGLWCNWWWLWKFALCVIGILTLGSIILWWNEKWIITDWWWQCWWWYEFELLSYHDDSFQAKYVHPRYSPADFRNDIALVRWNILFFASHCKNLQLSTAHFKQTHFYCYIYVLQSRWCWIQSQF